MGSSHSQPLVFDQVETNAGLNARLKELNKDLGHLFIHPRRLKLKRNGRIGFGGFGEVYLATLDKSREVAVKELETPRNSSDCKRIALRFARELKIWANLQHPNILKLLGYYLSNDCQVAKLISVYMANGNVSRYITQNQPDIATRLRFVKGITAGVEYLHNFDPRIIHGDIKPENVLISDTLDATLCDFGLASFIGSRSPLSGLTTTGILKGTRRYMSPELIIGDQSKHTLASDIWAWACTTYEILTDIKPFHEANDEGGILKKIFEGEMPGSLDVLLAQLLLNDSWSTGVSKSIISCWDLDPSKRPSVAMLIRDCAFPSTLVAAPPVVRVSREVRPKMGRLIVPQALEILKFVDGRASLNYFSLLSGWTLITRLRWEPPRQDAPNMGTETTPPVIRRQSTSPQPTEIFVGNLIPSLPLSTNGRGEEWLLKLLTYQGLFRNRYTSLLWKRWNALFGEPRAVQNMPLQEADAPKRRMLVISMSVYHDNTTFPTLPGCRNDWKLWAMLGMMSGWNVDIVADSLPIADSAKSPTKDNIRCCIQALLKNNKAGDQFVLAYSGNGDIKGLVLANGSHISPQELRSWLVRPLNSGSTLWTFFDCSESSNLLGLPQKVLYDTDKTIKYQPTGSNIGHEDAGVRGTVVSIGSAAGPSGEIDLTDPVFPTQDQIAYCGPLAVAAYIFFYTLKGGEPFLAKFWPCLAGLLAANPGQGPQITASSILQNPVLPMLRPLPA